MLTLPKRTNLLVRTQQRFADLNPFTDFPFFLVSSAAYHEGGHAVRTCLSFPIHICADYVIIQLVALYTPGAYPLQSVTVVPRGNALG